MNSLKIELGDLLILTNGKIVLAVKDESKLSGINLQSVYSRGEPEKVNIRSKEVASVWKLRWATEGLFVFPVEKAGIEREKPESGDFLY